MPALAGVFAPDVADFSGADTPSGWVVDGGEYRSPEYPNAVDRIEIAYTGAVESASATVYASNTVAESQIATFTAASSAASFDFPDTTDFRSFRISTANGLALSSFAAYVSPSALDAPGEVAVSNNTTGISFDASWQPVAGAAGYRVYVWTNAIAEVVGGFISWRESFTNAPATANANTKFKTSYTDSGAAKWTFDNYVYASVSNGAVRIGNTTKQGVLVTPPLPHFVLLTPTLRIRAMRQESDDAANMPIMIVSEGATNDIGEIVLAAEFADYELTLPALAQGDMLSFHSPTNKPNGKSRVLPVGLLCKEQAAAGTFRQHLKGVA